MYCRGISKDIGATPATTIYTKEISNDILKAVWTMLHFMQNIALKIKRFSSKVQALLRVYFDLSKKEKWQHFLYVR